MISKADFDALTPSMKHYIQTKNKNPQAYLFYRLGDFYELFFQDAIDVSKLLDLTLTKKSGGLKNKIPMCGVPYRVANQYISRLVNMGYKVAICDQVEDPKEAKGLVKREITKIVTPSTFTDTEFLKNDSSNLLMAIWIENNSINVASCNYLTGALYYNQEFYLKEEEVKIFLDQQFSQIRPAELLFHKDILYKNTIKKINSFYGSALINELDDTYLSPQVLDNLANLNRDLEEKFPLESSINTKPLLLVLNYLQNTQMDSLEHFSQINVEKTQSFLRLSESSKYNLEILTSIRDNTKKNTLYDLLDQCITSMGSRLLRTWIQKPLLDLSQIKSRQNFIYHLHENRILQNQLKDNLSNVYDFDRLAVKISQKSLSPKNLKQIGKSLQAIARLQRDFLDSGSDFFLTIANSIDALKDLCQLLDEAIIEDPTNNYLEERFIKQGFDTTLDELFIHSAGGQRWLIDLEKKEQEKTGIKNLKIKYNKILGYFFEITKSNLDLVPEYFIRKQTLVASERFYTQDLKVQEEKILSSKSLALERQLSLLDDLREQVLDKLNKIQDLAQKIATFDCLYSFSIVADRHNYICPKFNQEGRYEVEDARHPVVESQMLLENYVPNNVLLDNNRNRIQIITGPNMSGKSTYMRQIAILIIMAQIGSYVPASKADIAITDNIFTRIGASDNLASGQSTFMVEMMEVSFILKNLTENSLVLLDEVGRGTSTHDGLSIALALVEYMAQFTHSKILFATHYYQLTKLEKSFNCIKNLTIATEKDEDTIRFLRKIIQGKSNHSYGIEVAKLAGVDQWIIDRAKDLINTFGNESIEKNPPSILKDPPTPTPMTTLEPKEKMFVDEIKTIDLNTITPIDALQILVKYQKTLKGE